MMKKILVVFFMSFWAISLKAQDNTSEQKKANDWVAELKLDNAKKEEKVKALIFNHLVAVKDWHNSHPASTVPAGINPRTGERLNELYRSIIADSAMPTEVHQTLMNGLRQELTPEQVIFILDKYTVGKVDFTMKGYKAIVPDLTAEEEKTIRTYLEEAREMAIDFKNMKQISAIFEIYKDKSEAYLNANGRSWRQLYKDYTNKIKAEKAQKSNEK
ncbi:hypothetical protein Pedsa_0325 [Pseudopedobacter saltans DSM 12145]|uniref:DUF3826 domain-containing protein n=1 Tax=Pseudopedobacter saltans (strain ATCC 51119 / DSM 12145 / JCM 21818 / CCUG 39354 / LMG 10337 / NBRC 100064 / NCIMB 13643) TaxID=762903 RepID=F0S4F1_PSESL|nr:DUF3826 domain-containing protein [Pseudopedobacter saltans]ADY50908.1 hypothetical protein Pedsa_0325 [Pseudopedobacter saltans DSM 12145]